MKKLILFMLMFVFMLSFISAVSPFITSNNGGLEFAYSPYESVKANTDFKLHVHVINATATKTNLTTTCLVHIYGADGSHTGQNYMGYDSNGLEFTQTISAGNFTLGQHAYIVQCNSTGKEQGLVSGAFHVTKDGNVLDTPTTFIYGSGLIFLILLSMFIIMIINKLPDDNARDQSGAIVSITWLKYLRPVLWIGIWAIFLGITFITANITLTFLSDNMIGNLLFAIFKVMLAITIVGVPIYVIWIFLKVFQDREFKKMLDRGVDLGGNL